MRDWRKMRASARQAVERLPLKWRLALASFGLLAVLMAALGALISFTQEQAMLANQAIALRQEARLAVGARGPNAAPDSMPPPPVGAFPPEAQGFATNLVSQLTNPSTRANILAPDGTLLFSDSGDVSEPPLVIPRDDAIERALTTAQPDDAYFVVRDSSGQRQLVILLPLIDVQAQRTVALLELSTPTTAIDRSVAAIRLTLAVGTLIALAIGAALTIPLMNAALRPLVAMERTSRSIAAGALSLRLDVPPTRDEIGRLARAFNSMVAQLEAAFARQKRFVADVSHELRTPLTALGGGLEMLLLGADRGDPAASRRLLRGLYAEVERMRRLVEDLLTLTRLDEGHTTLRLAVVDVGPLLGEMSEEAERLARGQALRREIAADLPRVRVDADRLRQVLLALLDNAIKYTPATGQVTLRARRAEDRGLLIQVQDTGVGIPPEALPHVFERFYRVDPARERESPQAGGSGLGLAIARGLVEAQGGWITLTSAPGEGTTASIWFPAVSAAPDASARAAAAQGETALPTTPEGAAERGTPVP
jgi:two-component system OmpR family sensor kinase